MKKFFGMQATSGRSLLVLSVLMLLAVTTTANAAAVNWTNAVGSNARFGWSAGQSGDGDLGGGGLWGDPTVTEDGFFFNDMDSNFKAEATYDQTDAITSSVQFTMNALATSPITEIHVREWGTFTGDVSEVSNSSGVLQILFMVPGAGQITIGQLNYSFDEIAGTWSAAIDADITALHPALAGGAGVMGVAVTNHLDAIPGVGSSASIQKTGGSITIPEPATFVFGIFGLLTIVRRRSL